MNWFKHLDFYCERTDLNFWAEPTNALSNIFFVLAGFYILNRSLRVKNLNNKAWLVFLSITIIAVGVGSFLFHTFANVWSLYSDMIPILVFMAGYISFIFLKVFKINSFLTLLSVCAFITLTLYIDQSFLKLYFNGSTTYFPAWLMTCFIAQALYPKEILLSSKLYSATLLLAISILFRSIDNMFCNVIPVGTHHIWHMLNAVVLFTLLRGAYLYSKSDNKAPKVTAE